MRRPSPRDDQCSCGRLKNVARFTVHHWRNTNLHPPVGMRTVNHYCECGKEWATTAVDVDPDEPITAEEIITVHELLTRAGDVSLTDLLDPGK